MEIKPIWIGQTEVTWDEYDVFWQLLDIPEGERNALRRDPVFERTRPGPPYIPPERGWGHDGSPAGSMPCKWAKAYCAWLSKKSGKTYRLPTDAEWEYACRAGGPRVRLEEEKLKKVAWYAGNADGQTHPVAKLEPNGWGLYDMLGNVAEWVTHFDPQTREYKEYVAGGSFKDKAADVHSGARSERGDSWDYNDPETPPGTSWFWEGGHVGFRVVREE